MNVFYERVNVIGEPGARCEEEPEPKRAERGAGSALRRQVEELTDEERRVVNPGSRRSRRRSGAAELSCPEEPPGPASPCWPQSAPYAALSVYIN